MDPTLMIRDLVKMSNRVIWSERKPDDFVNNVVGSSRAARFTKSAMTREERKAKRRQSAASRKRNR